MGDNRALYLKRQNRDFDSDGGMSDEEELPLRITRVSKRARNNYSTEKKNNPETPQNLGCTAPILNQKGV